MAGPKKPPSVADYLVGTARNDSLSGGGGNDTLLGMGGNDTLLGGTESDSILGGLGNDSIDGGDGNDVLDGEAGNDTVYGGKGDDQLLWSMDGQASQADVYAGGDGNDTLTLHVFASQNTAAFQAQISQLNATLASLAAKRTGWVPGTQTFTLTLGNNQITLSSIEHVVIGTNLPDPNVAPMLASDPGTVVTDVVWDTDLGLGPDVQALGASGQFAFSDPDVADPHTAQIRTVSDSAGAGAPLLSYSLNLSVRDSSPSSLGHVDWNFWYDPAQIDYLASGQTRVLTFDVAVVDSHQASTATTPVAITLTGLNDGIGGTIPEAQANLHFDEDTQVAAAQGVAHYTDPDRLDTHTAVASLAFPVFLFGVPIGWSAGALDTLSLNDPHDGTFTVDWRYTPNATNLQVLSEGEQFTQDVSFNVSDLRGGLLVQTLHVDVTGHEDPVSNVHSDTVQVDLQAPSDTSPATVMASGNLFWNDPDHLDTFQFTVSPADFGFLSVNPAFGLDSFNGARHTSWNYFLPLSDAVRELGQGESAPQVITVAVADHPGGQLSIGSSASTSIQFNIQGVNDPVLAGGVVGDFLNEDAPAVTNHFSFTDWDVHDVHLLTPRYTGDPLQRLGDLTLALGPTYGVSGTSHTVNFTFTPTVELQGLSGRETVTQTFEITIDDQHGASDVETVLIYVVGQDDPTILDLTDSALMGSVVEDTGPTTASGTLYFSDVDLHDAFNFVPQAGEYGALTFDSVVALSGSPGLYSVDWHYSLDGFLADRLLGDGPPSTESFWVGYRNANGDAVSFFDADGTPLLAFLQLQVQGSAEVADQTLVGTGDSEVLMGGSGPDLLFGQEGSDTLDGATGHDTLNGGWGEDVFQFSTSPSSANVDVIVDMTPFEDRIALDTTVFHDLAFDGANVLLPDGLVTVDSLSTDVGAGAKIVYDHMTGGLYYDATGGSLVDAQEFAILMNHQVIPTLEGISIQAMSPGS